MSINTDNTQIPKELITLADTCGKHYTPPRKISGYFNYLCFRIWNVIKSCFGRSEWQVAKNKIAKYYQIQKQKDVKISRIFAELILLQANVNHIFGTLKDDGSFFQSKRISKEV